MQSQRRKSWRERKRDPMDLGPDGFGARWIWGQRSNRFGPPYFQRANDYNAKSRKLINLAGIFNALTFKKYEN